jgi:sulfur relay protein TusB/DsrH
VLLIQDGVFLADRGCSYSKEVSELGVPVYISRQHAEERGILSRMSPDVSLVEYDEIVDLVMEKHDKIISM